jgi:integrase
MSGKRGQGEGGIYRRNDGRWEAKFRLDGSRRSVYARTRKEVVERMRDALDAHEEGLRVTSPKDTVATFFAEWLAAMQPTLRARTFDRYEQYVRIHILPELGRIQLQRISPKHLQAAYKARLDAGLSPRSVAHMHALLHRGFEDAYAWGLLRRNPADISRPPKAPVKEMQALTPQEAARFLKAAGGDRLEALYVLAITTGMRQGEILALRWRDVDLEAGALSVTGTLHRTKERGLVVSSPKTKGSRRHVSLTPALVSALRNHHRAQASERLAAGPKWDRRGFVFTTEVGGPIEASNLIRRSFKPLLKKAKLAPIRFHDLRHTAASLMLAQGVHPKIVAEMLGHSNISVTMDTYSHVLPGMQAEAVRLMQELLWGPKRP